MLEPMAIIHELSELRHLSRCALSGKYDEAHRHKGSTEYWMARWASEQFNKAHPEYSTTFAYKVIERMLLPNGERISINFIQVCQHYRDREEQLLLRK